jgi:hypothetical protein
MRALLVAASASAVAVSLPCQATPGRVLVLVHETAPLRAALHEVDPVSGAVVVLPSFPSAGAVPLALAIDPATREPIVAVQSAAGSLLVRVHLAGQQVLGESVLGTVPGTVVGIAVPQVGDVFVATGGAAGGIVRVARQCCGSATFWSAAGITALSEPVIAPWKFWAARDLSPAAPRIDSFRDTIGPSGEGHALTGVLGAQVTGVHEYLGGSGRVCLLADTLGRLWTQPQQGWTPYPYAVQPPLVAGGAIRMKAGAFPRMYVLGGAADPTLKWFPHDVAFAVPPVAVLATFASAPVDFAVVAPATARTVRFGEPCALPGSGAIGAQGTPQLGNAAFAVRLDDGLPSTIALCALGWSERTFLGLPLPLALGACELLVSADSITVHLTDHAGDAVRAVPVPPVPALAGQIACAQWGLDLAALRTSAALALHLFP